MKSLEESEQMAPLTNMVKIEQIKTSGEIDNSSFQSYRLYTLVRQHHQMHSNVVCVCVYFVGLVFFKVKIDSSSVEKKTRGSDDDKSTKAAAFASHLRSRYNRKNNVAYYAVAIC